MDIKGMRYFISAADNLSFTKTALEQNVTQTAISLSISKMEDELGFQLFTRRNRSIQLTEAGRDFYERIVDIVKKYEEAVDHGLKTATGKVGEIRIGVPDCIMGMTLIETLKDFQKKYPQINVKVLIVQPHKVMQTITSHDIDVAIGFPQEFDGNTALQYRIFRKDKLLVAMSPSHPLASCSKITIGQMCEQAVAVVHPQKAPMVYQYICNIWEQIGFVPKTIIHEPTLDDALLEVALGNAIILITERSCSLCSPTLVYFHVKELDEKDIELAVAWNKAQDSPIIKGLIWALLED